MQNEYDTLFTQKQHTSFFIYFHILLCFFFKKEYIWSYEDIIKQTRFLQEWPVTSTSNFFLYLTPTYSLLLSMAYSYL